MNRSDPSGLDDDLCGPFGVYFFGEGCNNDGEYCAGPIYSFVPNPDPLFLLPCQEGIPVMPVAATTSGGAAPCDVELFTRPVGLFGDYGTHSFLEVWNGTGSFYTLEGGPGPGILAPKLVSFYTKNGYQYPDDAQGVPQQGGAKAISCLQANDAITNDLSFVTRASYDFTGIAGPNSNSFLHCLLTVSGLLTLFPTAPPGSIGWNKSVYTVSPPPARGAPAPGGGFHPPRPLRPA